MRGLTIYQLSHVKKKWKKGGRNDKAKGHSEADGMETEGIIYADGTSQRLLVHHVCMYKWMTCPSRFW